MKKDKKLREFINIDTSQDVMMPCSDDYKESRWEKPWVLPLIIIFCLGTAVGSLFLWKLFIHLNCRCK